MRTIDERTATLTDVIRTAMDSVSANLRCACPGIIKAYNADAQTVTVQLALREMISLDGVQEELEIPLLTDVPLVLPRAGGFVLAVAPVPGDECLIIFADMCIDAWWQSGGVQSQADKRRHDLSDGFAILGTWSQPRKPSIPTEGMSLQRDDGSVGITVQSDRVIVTGDLYVRGKVSNFVFEIDVRSYLLAYQDTGYVSVVIDDDGYLVATDTGDPSPELSINASGYLEAS